MRIHLYIIIIALALNLHATSQTLNLDSLKIPELMSIQYANSSNTSIIFGCHAPRSNKNESLLIIVNNKRFKNTLLTNFYKLLDTTLIKNIQVLNNKNDSAKVYGKQGENGVIIVTTHANIEWVAATDVLRKRTKLATKAFLMQRNDSTLMATTNTYLPKQLIKTIEVQKDTLCYFNSKQFKGLATITFFK